jgi:hypothetical protein
MIRRTLLIPTGLALSLIFGLTGSGCGGGGSTAPTSGDATPATATLVVVQGVPSTPSSVSLDGQVIAENLTYLTSTNPLIVTSGQHQLLLQDASGAIGPISNNGVVSLDLQPSTHTTVAYFGPLVFGLVAPAFTDDITPAANSMAKLRVVFASPTSEALEVFIEPFGSGPTGNPQIPSFPQPSSPPPYQTFPPGNYDVYFVTPSTSGGPPPTVRYHTGSLVLGANQNRSVYFLTACPNPPASGGCNAEGTYASVTVPDLN